MSDGCHGHGHAHGSDGVAAGVAAAADTEVDHLKAAIANLRLVQVSWRSPTRAVLLRHALKSYWALALITEQQPFLRHVCT